MLDPVAVRVVQLLKRPISCHAWSGDGLRKMSCQWGLNADSDDGVV